MIYCWNCERRCDLIEDEDEECCICLKYPASEQCRTCYERWD